MNTDNSCELDIHSSAYLGGALDECCKKELTVSLQELLFELQPDGDRTPPQSVTVTNSGKAAVKIKKVAIAFGAQDFIIVNSNAYPSELLKGESFNIIVDFTARVDGRAIGLLEIYTNEDKLPYVIKLNSRTERVPFSDAGYEDLYRKIVTEELKRASEDVRIAADASSLIGSKIETEANARIAGDGAETANRLLLDQTLRSLIASTNAIEAGIRQATDNDIYAKLALVIANQSNGTVFGTDIIARDMIIIERDARVTAVSAEAFQRLTLKAELNTAIGIADAKIVEEVRVRTSLYDAQASRLATIEANYQTAGQVTAIANARLSIEQSARASAIAAEVLAREQMVASLRTDTLNRIGQEALNREAAIAFERSTRVTNEASTSTAISTLTSRTSGGRGITPNGSFEAGVTGWTTNFDFPKDILNKSVPSSRVGEYATIFSAERIRIDTSRAYQINAYLTVFGQAAVTYVGVQCYNAAGTHLGNIYATNASNNLLLGGLQVRHAMTGEQAYPVPTFRTGTYFPAGTVTINLMILANYPSPISVAGSYTQVSYLWLEDITGVNSVDSRLTTIQTALTTRDDALASEIQRIEAEFNAGGGTDLTPVYNQITATNARIDNEQVARANAIGAEAVRVNNLLANYTTIGTVNSAISAAVNAEAVARANAIGAEASRITSLSTTVNGHTTQINEYAGSLDGIKARWGVAVDNNGVISGIELLSGANRKSEFLVNVDAFTMRTPLGDVVPFRATANEFRLGVDLHVGANRIIYNNGQVMKVQGTGFGTNNQFVSWFGPAMNINQCSESNAVTYERVDGRAYHGGALNAGTIVNPVQNTLTFDNISVNTGVVQSNGRTRQVTVNYTYLANEAVDGNCPAQPYPDTVTVELYYGDVSGSPIASIVASGGTYCQRGFPGEQGYRQTSISGTLNHTDNRGGNSAHYSARIVNRNVNVINDILQTLSLVEVEQ